MKLVLKPLFIVFLLAAVAPAFAQVVPSAHQGESVPLVVGVAYSNFTMDWGPGHRSSGISAWVDVFPFPKIMKNLGIEAEVRSSRWGNPVPNLREDTGQFGGIYSYSGIRKIHPYGKLLAGIGSIDFPPFPGIPNYKHDRFVVTSAAGGAELQASGSLWIRAEYQYQWWHNAFGPNALTPNGISVGAQWDFRRSNSQ